MASIPYPDFGKTVGADASRVDQDRYAALKEMSDTKADLKRIHLIAVTRWQFLTTIANFPITDPANQDAHNMQRIAKDALIATQR